ncbi:MAG: DNA polymerase/3'-5' exonuclease PolX [Candidatus Geothermincolia bacterium]
MRSVEELAESFDLIADLSEIMGEVRFKILAYRKAAEVVRFIGEPLLRSSDPKELRNYPGIGEGIAGKIAEYNETGRINKLEELKEEMPPELVELLLVPDLGPKSARLVYDRLGIRSLDDLEAAAEQHQLAQLRGLGPKAEENILEGIRQLRSGTGRMLLSEAHRTAREIIGRLREAFPQMRLDTAGSLRRMRETIGDVDILAASSDASTVMDVFTHLPMARRVLSQGETKSSIRTGAGLQVDLRVVEPEQWGAAQQYFTGSVSHNVKLREIAKKRGLKLNEYGVFRISDGTRIAGETEEDVYASLGLKLPPPELRENRGEIEAAQLDRLPRLIARDMIRGDLHVHTTASDGYAEIERLREGARKLGYAYLGIADHAASLRIAKGLSVDALLAQVSLIRRLNERKDGPCLLAASELNIDAEGGLDYEDAVLAELDYAVASIHGGFRQSREQITRRILKAMQNPHVRIIAHPTGRLLGARAPYEVDLQAVIEEAAATGTALELNAFPDRLDLSDEHLLAAKQLGVKIAIDSDAHRAEHLEHMLYGIAIARRGWLEAQDVVNAMELPALKTWLQG